jgi:hypothetical protein
MKPTTIEEMWITFRTMCIDPSVTADQVETGRKTFMCGAISMFALLSGPMVSILPEVAAFSDSIRVDDSTNDFIQKGSIN